MYKGLYRKRQLAYGGLLKQIKKELELDDIENGDLIHVDEETGEISEGTKIIAAWDWQRKIILLNKRKMDTHSLCLQKVKELYLSIFFVIERSDTILIEKSHYFVAFFEYVYTYSPLLASLLKKTGKQRVCVTQTPKSAFSTFLFRVPKTLLYLSN